MPACLPRAPAGTRVVAIDDSVPDRESGGSTSIPRAESAETENIEDCSPNLPARNEVTREYPSVRRTYLCAVTDPLPSGP